MPVPSALVFATYILVGLTGNVVFAVSPNYKKPPDTGCTLRDPVPAKKVCEQKGYLTKKHYKIDNDPAPVANFKQCLDVCTHMWYCSNFSFDSKAKLCKVFLGEYKELGFVPDDSSSVTYSEGSCYKCPDYCPQDFNNNVLDNGGFQYSTTSPLIGPWSVDAGYQGYGPDPKKGQIISPGSNSSQAWQCANEAFCGLAQYYQACPGRTYYFQFDYKVENAKKNTKIDIEGSGGRVVFNVLSPGTDGWQTLRSYLQKGKLEGIGGSIFFFLDRPAAVDNIQLYPIPKPKFKPGAANQIVNGGFQSGSLKPWVVNKKAAKDVSIVEDGDSNYLFSWSPSGDNRLLDLTQTFPTEAGKTYLFQADYIAKKSKTGVVISLGVVNQYGEPVEPDVPTQIAITYYAVANETTVNFEFIPQYFNATIEVDNVQFRELA